MARAVSFIVLVIITSVLLGLFYQVISVFLLPLFIAAVAVLMLRPLHLHVVDWCRGRRYVAAAIMTASLLSAVLIPFAGAFLVAGHEAAQLVDELENGEIRTKLNQARYSLGLDYPFVSECRFIESSLEQLRVDAVTGAIATGNQTAIAYVIDEFERLHAGIVSAQQNRSVLNHDTVLKSLTTAADSVPGTLAYQQAIEAAAHDFQQYKVALLGGSWRLPLKELANPTNSDIRAMTGHLFAATPGWVATFSGATSVVLAKTIFGMLIFVVALFFWFADGPDIVRTLMVLSPLEDRYEKQLFREFELLIRAMVAGSIASAIAQALLCGLGYWFVGMQSIILLTCLTLILAMMPFVGASLVWVPVSAWLVFGEGRAVAGIALAIYGAAIVSTVDNLIRPWFLSEKSALHPLAALIGVLGGMQALGPTGLFVGPIVVAFLQTLLTLLHREFAAMDAAFNRIGKTPAVVSTSPEATKTSDH